MGDRPKMLVDVFGVKGKVRRHMDQGGEGKDQ